MKTRRAGKRSQSTATGPKAVAKPASKAKDPAPAPASASVSATATQAQGGEVDSAETDDTTTITPVVVSLADPEGAVVAQQARLTPASGRWWKPLASHRTSAMVVKKKAPKGGAWARRKAKEKAKSEVIMLERELREQYAQSKQEARARSDERAKQRAENIKKSEIVVPITDTRKIKKMTRKQVRALDKR